MPYGNLVVLSAKHLDTDLFRAKSIICYAGVAGSTTKLQLVYVPRTIGAA